MRKCRKCLVVKSTNDFYKQKGTKTGIRHTCKACQYMPNPRCHPTEAVHKHLYHACKNSAIFRELEFVLTLQQHKEIISQNCYICGAKPVPYNHYTKEATRKIVKQARIDSGWIVKNGVDRVDNSKGYTVDNCKAACVQCNYAKQDYSLEEYVNHCHKVIKFNEAKNYKK